MRKLIALPFLSFALATCVPAPALAEVFATAENKAGGKIVLTDLKGDCAPMRAAFMTSGSGQMMTGCWAYIAEMFIVVWEDGDKTAYPPDERWTLGEKYRNAKPAGRQL